MFSNEIRETVNIAIALFLAAMVLGLVAIVIGIRGDFAVIRNTEISTAESMAVYREYNNYNNKVISSEEVIAMITKYYDSGAEIYFNDKGKSIRYSKETNPDLVKVGTLMEVIGTGSTHWVGLVYDYDDVTKVNGPQSISGGYYADVTGIVVLNRSVAE